MLEFFVMMTISGSALFLISSQSACVIFNKYGFVMWIKSVDPDQI